MKPQFLIGSVGQGNGKTLLCMGIARMLAAQGQKVQLYKTGPDVSDTLLHGLANDADSYILDTWLASRNHVKYVFNTHGEKADVCIVDGNGGLFDGYKRMNGSGADLSQLLNLPVILVVSARMGAYSIAPVIYGFRNFRKNVRVVGVIFNHVSSASQYTYLKETCRDAGVECFGYMPYDEGMKYTPSQLIPTIDNRKKLNEIIELASHHVRQTIYMDKVLAVVNSAFPCEYSLPYSSEVETDSILPLIEQKIRISVAKDAAFCLPYAENIDRMSRWGEITYFSPMNSRSFPETDLLYIPDGFVENFLRQLHRRRAMLAQIKEYAEKGGRIMAEGTGILLLARSVVTRSGNTSYDMADVFPFDCSVAESHLQAGLRKFERGGLLYKGYEYRCPYIIDSSQAVPYQEVHNLKGQKTQSTIYRKKNVIAGFSRWYWGESDLLTLFQM